MKKILILLSCLAAFVIASGQTKTSFIPADSIRKVLQAKHDAVTDAKKHVDYCKNGVKKLERNSISVSKLINQIEVEQKKIQNAKDSIINFAKRIGETGDFAKYPYKQDLLKKCIVYSLSEQIIQDLDSATISKMAKDWFSKDDSLFLISKIGVLEQARKMTEQLKALLVQYKNNVLEMNSWNKQEPQGLSLFDEMLEKSDYYNNYYKTNNWVSMQSIRKVIDQLLQLKKTGFDSGDDWENVVSKLEPSELKFNNLQRLYGKYEQVKTSAEKEIEEINKKLTPYEGVQEKITKAKKDLEDAQDAVEVKKKEHDDYLRVECINKVLKARCDTTYIAELLTVVHKDSMYLYNYKNFYNAFVPMVENYRKYHVDFAKIASKWYHKAGGKVANWAGLTSKMEEELTQELKSMDYWTYFSHRSDKTHDYASITYLDNVIDDYLKMIKNGMKSKEQYINFMKRIADVNQTKKNDELKADSEQPSSANLSTELK